LGVQSARRLSLAEQEKSRLSTESIANELAFLRHQVSPHFCMNTLNNIHALIDLDQAKAKESVIQLSTMMRHLLHDTGIEQSTVQQELAFVQSYVDLMSLRFSDRVNITLRLPDPIPSHPLPSLLFTNLLENAFSYGISYEEASFIDIECQISDNKLIFIIVNSNFAPPRSESHMGIGLRNTQKRLHLLYPDDHTLDISDEDKTFRISLSIPL
ncbi:MAG: histidine kinase, partial [Saprospiraceae bacterium]|nr:histidine kinase [Saprospiraceae bacterium]